MAVWSVGINPRCVRSNVMGLACTGFIDTAGMPIYGHMSIIYVMSTIYIYNVMGLAEGLTAVLAARNIEYMTCSQTSLFHVRVRPLNSTEED